jgi:ATP-dependent DNA helicase RecG
MGVTEGFCVVSCWSECRSQNDIHNPPRHHDHLFRRGTFQTFLHFCIGKNNLLHFVFSHTGRKFETEARFSVETNQKLNTPVEIKKAYLSRHTRQQALIMKSTLIDETLIRIKQSLSSDEFIDVEKSKVELKDLSTGNNWKSLNETICAFLNTDGGIVVCGVREKNKQYILTGFNRNSEGKLTDLDSKFFKDDRGVLLDVSGHIYLSYETVKDKEVAIIAVFPLTDDLKYVQFDEVYYERKLTRDCQIPQSKLQKHREYKAELEYAKELALVADATIKDLSLDKINNYVNLLNREIRNETLKPSITKAKPFLANQHFVREENVTTLGMLVCGADPYHFLGGRAEVNAYFDTDSGIGKDKKLFRSDVITLMEDSFRFVWGHIRVGRTVADGGKSEPEYPEQLVREVINNALAHRDYTIDGFVSLTVEPGQYLEVRNPGSFKEKMKLVHTETDVHVRRLIHGIPESKNPKLAGVLKVFDKLEGQSRGMSFLINTALENLTDLPYYIIKDNLVTLRIPQGKLLDEGVEVWLAGYSGYITSKLGLSPSEEQRQVLAYFYKSELLNKKRFFTILLNESNNHFQAIDALRNAGLLDEHVASTEEAPVFILNRTLLRTEFHKELRELMGDLALNSLDQAALHILNLTYQYTVYNDSGLKASELTPEIYRRLHGKNIIPKKYESLGRQVRKHCAQLESEGILIREEKKAYRLNCNYKQRQSLFSGKD